jgi:large subunit ribosomal protein L17
MRHRLSRLRLRQKPAHSNSLQRNLVTSLLLYETIRTTHKRAKVVQPLIDQLITVAKKKEPREAVRALNKVVTHRNASRKMMEVFKDRFKDRTSGFTRIIPLGSRRGDGAELVTLELLGAVSAADAPVEKPAKKVSAKASA